MQLNTLKRKNENFKSASVGRGGKRGKTSGRGTKGQKSRSGRKIRPEIRDAIKRLPKLRGRGKNSNLSIQTKPVVVYLSAIEKEFENGSEVNLKSLMEKKVISSYKGKTPQVKILSVRKTANEKNAKFTKKVTLVGVKCSAEVKKLIEGAGGEVK